MSYFDSLASWQNGADAIQTHQQAIEQEYKNSKANDIEQQFDQVDKYLQEGGGGLTGLAAGFHVSRKIYQKIKTSQAKKKALREQQEAERNGKGKGQDLENEGDKAPNEHNGQQNGTEGIEDDWEDGGDFGFGDSKNPNKPPETDENSPDSSTNDNDGTPAEEEDEPEEEDFGFGDTENPNVSKPSPPDLDDAPEPDSGGAAPEPEEEEEEDEIQPAEPTRPAPAQAAEEEIEPAERSLGQGDLVEMDGGGTRVGQTANDVAASAEDNIRSAADGGADAAKTALGGLKESGADALENIASKGSDIVGQGLSKVASVGSKAAEVGGDLISTGLDTASTVLDFLGPVGEVVGAGIMIGSFFHDLFGHKHKDAQEEAAQNAKGNISQASGISTTSMAAASVKSNVVGTLV